MTKLTKRTVDAADVRERDYFIWDDELPGFGLRVFASGKRSYLIQYRAAGRTRRYTIGLHGVWTPETARQEAKVQFGRVARGDNPSEERQLNHKAITVKELCALYVADLNAGLILGKGGRPKKPTTISTDTGRIDRHIIPLIGTRRVKDLTTADINKVLKDIMAGKTRVAVKTKKLRGKAIVRGGAGTATRTVGLLGGILTYAVEAGIIDRNPAHGIRKPKDNVRNRRLTHAEYRTLGEMLRAAALGVPWAWYSAASPFYRLPPTMVLVELFSRPSSAKSTITTAMRRAAAIPMTMRSALIFGPSAQCTMRGTNDICRTVAAATAVISAPRINPSYRSDWGCRRQRSRWTSRSMRVA